ncbi:MAG TPA: PQQ-binding-like beta-propeller repeat protein, partial [Sediminibacterium sp.]|nr:PQQ-binding-like beta-propeller repeat protein [Sediminibacterium sp.]
GRSNLRAKAAYGGYNLVDVTPDSLVFSERTPGINTQPVWTAIRLENHQYDTSIQYPRPSYAMNDSFPQVHPKWTYSAPANVISTPAIADNQVIFGNSQGLVQALNLTTGKKTWSFATGGAIYSSPAASKNRIVFGSCDGNIYCLSAKTGKKIWSLKTDAAVLGCPLIAGDTVWIGGSDHTFRSIRLSSGKEIWRYDGLQGPVVSTPLHSSGLVIFGAWDSFLYALNSTNGALVWKWSNGSSVPNLSPAACMPVTHDGVVYIAAPDRFLSAIAIQTGQTLWRSNASTFRESIGISANGQWIYGKTMHDTLVAYPTSKTLQQAAWKLNCGFGYEHVPSMPVEKEGTVFFGTRSGVIYAVNPIIPEKRWSYKLDNSMVNTVRVLNGHQLVAATMDGKIALLETQ